MEVTTQGGQTCPICFAFRLQDADLPFFKPNLEIDFNKIQRDYLLLHLSVMDKFDYLSDVLYCNLFNSNADWPNTWRI